MVLLASVMSADGRLIEDAAEDDPGERWGHTLVWDPGRQEVLLFGGARAAGEYLDDTWSWDGETWRRHELTGPPARAFAAAAFHQERGTIILHGGRAEGRRPHMDTWEWNGLSWKRLDTRGSFAADHHGMVYLPSSRTLMAFGGWTGDGVSGETWLFDGDWRLAEGPGPPPRASFALTFHHQRQAAVLFGGLWIEGQYADVWEWTDGAWRAASAPYENSSIDHHSMIWDPVRRQVTGFGGKNYRYQALDRTFRLSGGSPETLAEQGPTPRHSSQLAWDGKRRSVVLYGGKTYEGREQVALGDMWAWDGRSWRELD